MSETATSPPRTKRRILFRLFRGLLVFVVLLIVTYLIADQILLRKVQRQREVFKERFGAVDFRDFIPERPAPEEDAGRVYLYAAGLMAKVDEEHGDWSMYDALIQRPEGLSLGRGETPPTPEALDTMVEAKMASMEEAFRSVEEAGKLGRGSIVGPYDHETAQPALAEARALVQNIAARALYEARTGDLEGACTWLESGLHATCTMNDDPTLAVQIMRTLLVGLVLDAAESAMNAAGGPLPFGERYWKLLNRASDTESIRQALASEASFSMSKPMPIPRFLWSLSEIKLMEFHLKLDDARALTTPRERREKLDDLKSETESLFAPAYLVARIIATAHLQSADAFDEFLTHCSMARLASELQSIKQQTGAYPEALQTLESVLAPSVLIDPFTAESLKYRRQEVGFLLYSVGQDRTDDGGVERECGKPDLVWSRNN